MYLWALNLNEEVADFFAWQHIRIIILQRKEYRGARLFLCLLACLCSTDDAQAWDSKAPTSGLFIMNIHNPQFHCFDPPLVIVLQAA